METIGVRIASSGMNSSEGSACTPASTTTNTTGSIVSEDTIDSRSGLSSNREDSSAVTIPCTTDDCPSSIDSSDAAQRTNKHGSNCVKPVSGDGGTQKAEDGSETRTSSCIVVGGNADSAVITTKSKEANRHSGSGFGTVISPTDTSEKRNDDGANHINVIVTESVVQHNKSGCGSCLRKEDEDCGYLSESRNNGTINTDIEDGEKTPVQPNFCVEGMSIGGGDSSVTVAALASLSRNTLVDEADLELSITSSCCHGEGEDSVAESGSAPLSVQSSEDMKLSLVSWYSEPEEPTRDCCNSGGDNLISRAVAAAANANKLLSGGTTTVRARLDTDNESMNDEVSQDSLVIHDKSDEKENKTPMRPGKSLLSSKSSQQTPCSQHQQRIKMHVQLTEQNPSCVENGKALNGGGPQVSSGLNGGSSDGSGHGHKKPECPRCARRSKSGTTTPAAPAKTSSRRVVQSSKSTHELKKPIKSILKSDSRSGGSRSGSGSEKQSSMDSLGSASGIACVMTRSDGCNNSRTRFSHHNSSFSSCSLSPEDKNAAAKLKRIEKYATLRLKKPRVKTASEGNDAKGGESQSRSKQTSAPAVGTPGMNPDIMSKSMSFLEKSSHSSSCSNHNSSTLLKRQGSLRLRKPSPMWEPSGTRTSALRMQKVQEAKAKTNKGAPSGHSGSNHSGSGESIHVLATGTSISNGHHHHYNAPSGNSCGSTNHQHQQRPTTLKDKHCAKVFTKLSSASGQTTSSAMKRIRQERGVQTDAVVPLLNSPITVGDGLSPTRMSPLPSLDHSISEEHEVKRLESLVQRYRARAHKMQLELDRSEERNHELQKQLQETQSETNEMIEFLQAEKSLLAESLTEAESESKRLQEQVEAMKNEAQSRCSSLVRLSEQHKQEALKAQALLHRMEVQSNALISKQTADMSEAALGIQKTRNRILSLIEKLMKTYKVSQELLASAGNAASMNSDETELNSSLLVPLITALKHAFPAEEMDASSDKLKNSFTSCVTTLVVDNGIKSSESGSQKPSSEHPPSPPTLQSAVHESRGSNVSLSSSLQNLSQAILEREAAERLEQDCEYPDTLGLDSIHDGDHLCLKTEIRKLNEALLKLVTVIRVIVVYCDKKVSGVTSNILQCLRSIEDDKVGSIPEMMHVQKSLEAWKDSTQCKQTVNHPSNKISSENGHT